MSDLSKRLAAVRLSIAAAAARSGRSPDDVELVAVSKAHPPEALQEAIAEGQCLFGESRIQEARAKIPLLPGRARWHFIGHLQKNKIRQALPLFERFHGIDSMEVACDLDRISAEAGARPRILLEVNVAGESTKFGFAPDALEGVFEELLGLERVFIDGLMCLPPPVRRPEEARKYFVALRTLRDRLQTRFATPLPELSMGMSEDFAVAIEEGATMVRVGSAIFGDRRGKMWKPEQSPVFED